MNQTEYLGKGKIEKLREILSEVNPKHIFLVTGKNSYTLSGAEEIINKILPEKNYTRFNDFTPNPKLEDIMKGCELLSENKSELIIAIGGGSVIDTAKLINVFDSNHKAPIDYITKKQELTKKLLPFIAIPTTAGAGSEATHFAVVYVDGIKYSLAHEWLLPDYAIVDPDMIKSQPRMVAAASGMDALAQSIESYWSVNSTEKSKEHSTTAIKLIIRNFVKNVNQQDEFTLEAMALGAHYAGKAINITKTTAPHALSYTFTSKLGVPHGHAVMLNLLKIYEFNSNVSEEDCMDSRGVNYVKETIYQLNFLLGCKNKQQTITKLGNMMDEVGLERDLSKLGVDEDFKKLISEGVNYERLKNNPRKLTKEDIESLFKDSA